MSIKDPKLLEDIFRAYYDARRNKRNTINQLRFEMNLEQNLSDLYVEIVNNRYKVGRSVCFMIDKPVKREIFAANFRDRVVHHLLFNYVAPIFEKTFINDCFSCRKGKGTLYGIRRLEHHIRSATQNYTKTAYVLKLDIQGYFMSINRDMLYKKMEKILLKFADRKSQYGVLWRDVLDYDRILTLTKEIIYDDPTHNCLIKGRKDEWKELPRSKSLFGTPQGVGLPIGNLTSQLFSNVYLTEFDNYVKRDLKAEYYGRYVDDFYIVANDKEYLKDCIKAIEKYLRENLELCLHPKKIYLQNINNGVNFLGATIKPYRRYVVNKTRKQFNIVMYNFERECAKEQVQTNEFVESMRSSINSYMGYLSYYKSYKHTKKVIERCPSILKYGHFTEGFKKFVPRFPHRIGIPDII